MKQLVFSRMIVASISVVLAGALCLPLVQAESMPQTEETAAQETIVSAPPVLVLLAPEYNVCVSEGIPAARDLILGVSDGTQVEAFYAQEPEIPDDYGDILVPVVVQDSNGTRIESKCVFHFNGWMKESVTLELGQKLTPEMLLVNPEKDAAKLDPSQLPLIPDAVGKYTIAAAIGNSEAHCKVTVADTTAPELTVRDLHLWPGQPLKLEDFIVSSGDLSGQPRLRYAKGAPDNRTIHVETVVIEAKDASGNITTAQAQLRVGNDHYPPKIGGGHVDIVMKKGETPDFLAGMSVVDGNDKAPVLTVDTSTLAANKAGTYYITYTATDKSGNVATYKRRVIVEHDHEDTDALLRQIADTLPDDPEAIRDYVRTTIAYNHNYGGDDPIWYGLKNKVGNCYVHALTLKALLDLKGYETQLIWVTNKSHYWVIIKLEEGWRHIDATPSAQHMAVSLMTDEERAAHINGREWDRTAWPACE